MNIEHLVMMANQIGSFYETMPDHKKAVADIADHIKKFWEPRMRRALLDHIDRYSESGQEAPLLPIVMESVQLNRLTLSSVLS